MADDHPDLLGLGDRVRLKGTKSDRNTGIVLAIKKPGTKKTRVIVKPDHPTESTDDLADPEYMSSPEKINNDNNWDCALGELELVTRAADIEVAKLNEVLHLKVGEAHMYDGNPDDVWIVCGHDPDAKYAYCSKGGLDRQGNIKGKAKNIPAALLTPVEAVTKARRIKSAVPAPRREKKRKDNIGDAMSDLLQEADTINELWMIAEAAGMDVVTVKAKIAHLNPGLQRMGIGNRLRHMKKVGTMKPIYATRTSAEGFQVHEGEPE